MIVLSISETKTIDLLTPLGKEKAICYMGWTFLATTSYKEDRDAFAACRRDLDVGLFSIVVQENGKFSIWCPLPTQMLNLQPT